MLELAWQNVRRQPGRFAASAGAVASSVMLVVVSSGLYLGMIEALAAYPRTLPGDLVVAEAGMSASLLRGSSRVPLATVARLRQMPGVAAVEPFYGRLLWLRVGGRQALVYLVGVDPHGYSGGPVRLVEGRRRPRLGEIVIDRVLAHDLRVRVGDRLPIGPAKLRVVGIAGGGNAVLGTFAFAHTGTLQLGGVLEPSLLLVRAAGGMDPGTLRGRLAELPGLQAFTRAEFLAENQALVRQLVLPLIAIVVAVSALVGGVIVALALHAATVARSAEYGLLKAIGVGRRQLYGVAVAQGGITASVGAMAGLIGGVALAGGIGVMEPRFVTTLPAWLALVIAGGAVTVGLAAAMSPVRVIARIDPALVFRV